MKQSICALSCYVLAATWLLYLALGGVRAAEPGVIDNLGSLNGSIQPFGEAPGSAVPYAAQSFVALPGFVQDLTFLIEPLLSTGPTQFHLLLVDTAPGSAIPSFGVHPTNVLFESQTITLSGPVASFDMVTANLGGIGLTVGHTYAWMLDFLVTFDGVEDLAALGDEFELLPMMTAYQNGHQFHWFNAFTPSTDRAANFANTAAWIASPGPTSTPPADNDLVFRLTFSDEADHSRTGEITVVRAPAAIPWPSSSTLLSFGILGLGMAAWRRRGRAKDSRT